MANSGVLMGWLMMLMNIAAIAVLALYVRLENRRWLQAFLVLLFVTGAGNLIPSELYRSEIMSSDAYREYFLRTSQVFNYLRLAAWVCMVVFVVSLRSVPAAAGAAGGTRASIPSAASPTGDFFKGGVVLPDDSRAALCERLKAALPGRVEVAISERRPNEIRVRDGLWRGASLKTDEAEGKIRVVGITYDIPTSSGKILIFLTSIVLHNIIMVMLFSSITGRMPPGAFVLGGVAGFAMYTIVKLFFVAGIRSSWAPELNEGIAKMRALSAA
jgi:hypothetical protein